MASSFLGYATWAAAILAFLVAQGPAPGHGHGMLMEPVNRGSMWRVGYNTPSNYLDTQQFCGGFHVQWDQNDGKCGECGDDWALPRPRAQENTGVYGTGQIVRTYKPGEVITAVADITANHLGGFVFKLCPIENPGDLETQECFDKHPVEFASGGYYHGIGTAIRFVSVDLRLPEDLTCKHCVLQWTYITGNSWGVCPNGTGTLGCGPQEHFRTCSDIAILSEN